MYHIPRPLHSPHPPFFFLSSTTSTLSSGTFPTSIHHSSISSAQSPCTVTSSPPLGVFVTLLPVANFFPHSFATFFKSNPCASSPATHVTYFRLLRSTRLICTMASAFAALALASWAAALASFFALSLAARFWASTERVESWLAMASVARQHSALIRRPYTLCNAARNRSQCADCDVE